MIPILHLLIRTRLLLTRTRHLLRRGVPRCRKTLLLPMTAACLALSSCSDDDYSTRQPQVTVTDTQPVGKGLTVIGFAIVGAAVVAVLGRLLR